MILIHRMLITEYAIYANGANNVDATTACPLRGYSGAWRCAGERKKEKQRPSAPYRTRGQPNFTHGGRTLHSSLRFIPATCMSGRRALMKYCIHREDVLGEHMLATVPRAPFCMHSSVCCCWSLFNANEGAKWRKCRWPLIRVFFLSSFLVCLLFRDIFLDYF